MHEYKMLTWNIIQINGFLNDHFTYYVNVNVLVNVKNKQAMMIVVG